MTGSRRFNDCAALSSCELGFELFPIVGVLVKIGIPNALDLAAVHQGLQAIGISMIRVGSAEDQQ